MIYIGVASSETIPDYSFVKISENKEILNNWIKDLNNKFNPLKPYLLNGIIELKNGRNIVYTESRILLAYERYCTERFNNEINLPSKEILNQLSIINVPDNGEVGIVYLLINSSLKDMLKVGITFRDSVNDRINELSSSSGVPTKFECLYSMKTNNPKFIESNILNFFNRKNNNREFIETNVNLPLLMQFNEKEDVTPPMVLESKTPFLWGINRFSTLKEDPTSLNGFSNFKALDIKKNSTLRLDTSKTVLFSDIKRETFRQAKYTVAIGKLIKHNEPITEAKKNRWKENTLIDRKENFYSNQNSLITVKTRDMVDKVMFNNETYNLKRLTIKLTDKSEYPHYFMHPDSYSVANLLLLWKIDGISLYERGLKMGLRYFIDLQNYQPHIYQKKL